MDREINSKAYWEKRFETDWLDFAGDRQSAFFAQLLCDMLPAAIAAEIRGGSYTVCDMGCAFGDGTKVFTRELGVDVDGMDFSETAVRRAKEQNPELTFWQGDLLEPETLNRHYDVVITSNVLEHFNNPWKILKNLAEVADRYLMMLVPYREELHIEEHLYRFREESIPAYLGDFRVCWYDIADAAGIPDTLYPGRQCLVIYARQQERFVSLADTGAGLLRLQQEKAERISDLEEAQRKAADTQREAEANLADLTGKLACAREEKEEQLRLLAEDRRKAAEAQEEAAARLADLTGKLSAAQKEQGEQRTRMEAELRERERELETLRNELAVQTAAAAKGQEAEHRLLDREQRMQAAVSLCYAIHRKTGYRLLCAFLRFVNQFLRGSRSDRRAFREICRNALFRHRSEFTKNDGYNFILNVANLVDVGYVPAERPKTPERADEGEEQVNLPVQGWTQGGKESLPSLAAETKEALRQSYTRADVLVLSVIDYDFRYQRPQQFADRFAEAGHRTFYVNANYTAADRVQQKGNRYVVNLQSKGCEAVYYLGEHPDSGKELYAKLEELAFRYAITDAFVIVDYPSWWPLAKRLRERFGFFVIADYMDDYTGFLNTASQTLVRDCEAMLRDGDYVIASSAFLSNIASGYTDRVGIVRNGTEFEHFHQAYRAERRGTKVIGYYGAVSHWFDWEKVCALAEQIPDAEIVIIGTVTEYEEQLRAKPNIRLLGEKPYAELPNYLKDFDVCLIPFDTGTDLIKATNPVKFYEYLSAGKKIVATEIPELEPFRDRYVYMANDDAAFAAYVRSCLDGTDTLADPADCASFARESDWNRRFEEYRRLCIKAVPKVSILVLTYNNLPLNQACLASVCTQTAYPNYELVVVDNGSTDGTLEYLASLEDEHVRVIRNPENLGFAGGNNVGIRASDGTYVMLLNNDTIVTRGWLTTAVKWLQNDRMCGMCGAVTNSIGNEAMIPVSYRNQAELREFAFLHAALHRGECYPNVDRIALFATLIRRDVLESVGLLDEAYKVGMFEDDDLAMAMQRAGYHFYLAEDLFIHHVNNASFRKLQSREYQEIFERNRAYYEQKWNTVWRMPHYRSSVDAGTNADMMKEPQ